jgi:heme O synthase-like polyprenyltransferase
MNENTASKHSINWFPILLFVVPCLWGLCFWLRDWPFAVLTAFISVYLVQDAWNLVSTRRAARKESKLLKEKALRT